MMPKVSFVVAMYKVAPYIERCLRSLYGQTYENMEYVLVDDASPDDSSDLAMRLLDEFPHRRNQVRLVRHEQNKGLSPTRRDGFYAATGDYVIFFDGDDYVELNMVEHLVQKALDEEADIVVCDYYNGRWFSSEQVASDNLCYLSNPDHFRYDIIVHRCDDYVWRRMFRRILITNHDFLWPAAAMHEDMVISSQLAFYASKVVLLPEPLVHYTFNGSSITAEITKQLLLNRFRESCANLEVCREFYNRQGLLGEYPEGMDVNILKTVHVLLRLTGQWKYRLMWLTTYPRVIWLMLVGTRHIPSTSNNRLWFFLIMLGLFPKHSHKYYKGKHAVTNLWKSSPEPSKMISRTT